MIFCPIQFFEQIYYWEIINTCNTFMEQPQDNATVQSLKTNIASVSAVCL